MQNTQKHSKGEKSNYLTKEILEREIIGAKAAVKAHLEGAAINKVVLDAMEKKLASFPKDLNKSKDKK